MKAVALICARGGSKGLPGKNVRLLGGRPLIAWAVAQAQSVARVSRVIVSTDSEEIARAARVAGADIPFMRPAELAADDSPEWLVWRHALSHLRDEGGGMPDALLVVPPTAPLRESADLDRCLDAFAAGNADVVITVTPANRSPYFNMVSIQPDGSCSVVIPSAGKIVRRQDVPAVFDMTTVAYVARPGFVMERSGLFDGRVVPVEIPAERAIDIDTPLDFRVAECLIRDRATQSP